MESSLTQSLHPSNHRTCHTQLLKVESFSSKIRNNKRNIRSRKEKGECREKGIEQHYFPKYVHRFFVEKKRVLQAVSLTHYVKYHIKDSENFCCKEAHLKFV